uniref:Uncharacterized protein n=1 Tax=Avena sativa TaxID=4498 RepID=A0ACD5XPH5_AVESA
MVSGKAERATDVSFTLDDGTGRIDFIRWVNDAADSSETAAIQNGMYVSVICNLKGLQDKERATAFCVRPVTDYNEVTMHFTQCVRMHIENTKSKVGSPAHTAGTPFSNNLSEASTPTSLKSNLPLVTSGTYGSGTDLYMRVLNVFSEPASIESDHGVHIDEIAKRLRLPVGKIVEAIEFHVNCGHIFSTIDDFHYKSAFIDQVCILPWVTSGTNGSGTDLYAQVLNAFSELGSIRSDRGVHIDEITKRLRLPAGKIKEAIEFHVDCGHIFSTIDDFHYKSAFIDGVCNSPSVTSRTNGLETDLYRQVLNVFSEPASM